MGREGKLIQDTKIPRVYLMPGFGPVPAVCSDKGYIKRFIVVRTPDFRYEKRNSSHYLSKKRVGDQPIRYVTVTVAVTVISPG